MSVRRFVAGLLAVAAATVSAVALAPAAGAADQYLYYAHNDSRNFTACTAGTCAAHGTLRVTSTTSSISASATTSAYSTAPVARVQIDSLDIVDASGRVRRAAGTAAPGNRGPVSQAAQYTTPVEPCRVYAVRLQVSARLTNGALARANVLSAWITTNGGNCPSRTADLDMHPTSVGYINTAIAISPDHSSIYAVSALRIRNSTVARIQFDAVELIVGSVPVASSGTRGPQSSDVSGASNGTLALFAAPRAVDGCVNFNVRVTYSVRYTSGALKNFVVNTLGYQFCSD